MCSIVCKIHIAGPCNGNINIVVETPICLWSLQVHYSERLTNPPVFVMLASPDLQSVSQDVTIAPFFGLPFDIINTKWVIGICYCKDLFVTTGLGYPWVSGATLSNLNQNTTQGGYPHRGG